MDDTALQLLQDTPLLLLVVIVGRWLAARIDRVLDMHERLIEKCFEGDRYWPTGKPLEDDPPTTKQSVLPDLRSPD